MGSNMVALIVTLYGGAWECTEVEGSLGRALDLSQPQFLISKEKIKSPASVTP